MKHCYIAGGMSGLPQWNFPAFHDAAARLRALGLTVTNPAEVNPDTTMDWGECMRRDIPALLQCDGIVLLPGWDKSRGAKLELHIAMALGMEVKTLAEALAPPADGLLNLDSDAPLQSCVVGGDEPCESCQ